MEVLQSTPESSYLHRLSSKYSHTLKPEINAAHDHWCHLEEGSPSDRRRKEQGAKALGQGHSCCARKTERQMK